ncbi:MAG: FlaD/FlaE family flagellar protein [Candidatus Thermoplasmatota archaeon]|nr:FlaD/FlaE family flagellar protein [Candidatus Thermoplasmatota archaeon]
MAKKKVEEEEFVIESSDKVASGEIKRYEVRMEPPLISGRKVKPVVESPESTSATGPTSFPKVPSRGQMAGFQGPSAQQIFKLEDDLRRTREVMEDLKHTSSKLEAEVKDMRSEMERVNYLLRSLEGLRNSLKDIESTVSELSGLYDMISSSINPFIDIPPLGASVSPAVKGEAPSGKVVEARDVFEDIEECFEDDIMDSDEWLLRWTKFLIDRVGKEGLERTLEYYSEMNWVDQRIVDKVFNIAKGIASPPRAGEGERKVTWKLDAEDHIQSLDFIKKIRGDRR